ncbi:MAG: flagellar M-ring protein FliF [Nitrospira sp.]|nr:flagellar M-ring protein FliF [bacterium]MBL7049355.1 flagellar M-ring protein FliF [Nitrospira sp.]
MASFDDVFVHINSWPASKKVALLMVIVISLAGIFLVNAWVQKVDYQILYANLSEEDAVRIVDELKSQKVAYELGATGTIKVGADKVYNLRLELAGKGMPSGGGVGFEIFDDTNFTTSEFVQKLNFKRALEGELSRTIRAMSAVSQSRVHLVMPDKSLFAFQNDKPESTASVFVTLNRQLNNGEVQGIVHLVSSAVEDLGPERITVVDDRGNMLTRPNGDSAMNMSSSQMEYQQSYEKNLVSKIKGILEPVVGANRIKTRISAEFDFTRSERTEETYDPDGAVIRSEQKSTEKTSSGGGGGVPGVPANLPGGAAGQFASEGPESEKLDEVINYETSKTIRRIVESPVTLKRLTVAILVDGILAAQKEGLPDADKFIVRADADIAYYEDIVRKTIGFSDERGDEISVTVMPFTPMDIVEMSEPKTDYMAIVFRVLKYLAPIIVALLFFLMVAKPLMQSISKIQPQVTTVAPIAQLDETEMPLLPREKPMEKQVIDWAASNPQQAAGLVKGWLEEK